MFQPGAMQSFAETYGSMLKHVRRVIVRHTGTAVVHLTYEASFTAELSWSGFINVAKNSARLRKDWNGKDYACRCVIEKLAAYVNSGRKTEAGPLINMLVAYANLSPDRKVQVLKL